MSAKTVKYIKIIIISLFIIAILTIVSFIGIKHYKKYIIPPIPQVNDVLLNENNLLIKFSVLKENKNNKIYCIFKSDDELPSVNDKDWVLSKNNECSIELKNNVYYAYLKNEDDIIYDVEKSTKIGKVTDFNVNKKQIYVAVNGTYSLKTSLDYIGYINKEITWSSENKDIAKVDENGKVTGLKKGNTIIYAKVMDKTVPVNVMVTDLITVRPKSFNSKKPYLPCKKYSEKDNDTLDLILKDRINDAGYKTRAGVVEAARFLALEFPYKIRYFSENGREPYVQGEGRYYNVGLYLHSSRFKNIKKSSYGPAIWGCNLYSRPAKNTRGNGLDCSGFVTWVLLNGGFDVKDVGAGVSPGILDLTDYGVKTKFNADVVASGKVKVGDLLSSEGPGGGHIALIVGEDDNYYYVAESLWTPPNVAVIIKPYSKKDLWKRYYYVMLMDSYYKEDGNLTKLWY